MEKPNLFLDLLQRHEKGALREHQRALDRYSLTKRRMGSAAAQSRAPESESVGQLESRNVEQENAIQARSSAATARCTACTRRRSWSTSTCRSPPTSSGSTPGSKGTRR